VDVSVVDSTLQSPGSHTVELISKDTPSRHSSNKVTDIPAHCEASDDTVSTAEARYERGPRIKHVCRRAAVVFGERATFPLVQSTPQPSAEINLSALPSHEKKHVVQLSAEGVLM